MPTTRALETICISYSEFHNMQYEDYKLPSRFYYQNCLGDFIFILTSNRKVADKYIKDNLDNFYKLREISKATAPR